VVQVNLNWLLTTGMGKIDKRGHVNKRIRHGAERDGSGENVRSNNGRHPWISIFLRILNMLEQVCKPSLGQALALASILALNNYWTAIYAGLYNQHRWLSVFFYFFLMAILTM
jgi:hypothetical protein